MLSPNIQCVRTSLPLARATIGLSQHPSEHKEVPHAHGRWTRPAPATDHLRRLGRRIRGDLARTPLAAGPVAVRVLAGTRGQRSSTRRLGSTRSGGLHGLALRRRRDLGSWLRTVPRRPGRHSSGERTQAPSEDRPHRWGGGALGSPTRGRLGVARTRRLYKSLVDQRTLWCQRIHAVLYHHGVTIPKGAIRTEKTRSMLADGNLRVSPAGSRADRRRLQDDRRRRHRSVALKHALQRFGTRQPACRALVDAQYGIGGLLAVVLWTELGDCRRFSRSEQVVRHSGLDVTVDSSDRRPRGRPPLTSGPRDASLGALRGGEELLARSKPRSRLLRQGERASRRQDRSDLRRPPVRATQLSRAAGRRSQRVYAIPA